MLRSVPIILIPYEINYADALAEIFHAAVRIGAASDYSKEQLCAWAPDTVEQEAWHVKRSLYPTWVALYETLPAGFIDLKLDGYIDMLYVHPDFHRRGIASTMLRHIFKEAEQRSIKQLFVEASITAHSFFESMGFSTIRHQVVFYNGQSFTNFQMQKML